jgi:hypothetical protein
MINFAILFIKGELLLWTNSTPSLEICFETWYYYSIKLEENKEKLVSLYELFELNRLEFDNIVKKLNLEKKNHLSVLLTVICLP